MPRRKFFDGTGGFQVRHRTLGVYQGSAIDLAFWHPSSGMPEHGLCRFATRENAHALIDVLCSLECMEPMERQDLTIEPFDIVEHDRLMTDHPLPSAWETPT
jgi:hypothetical protein